MDVGEFWAVFEDENGAPAKNADGRIREPELCCERTRCPIERETIRVNKTWFRVDRVAHDQEEIAHVLIRKYFFPVVYLRPAKDVPGPLPPSDTSPGGQSGGGPPSGGKPRTRRGRSNVVPFERPSLAGHDSTALDRFLAEVVVAGYGAQQLLLDALAQVTWELEWDGREWFLERAEPGLSGEELHELSREAKRECTMAAAFANELHTEVRSRERHLKLVPAGAA